MDMKGKALAYTPFCDNNKEMDEFRWGGGGGGRRAAASGSRAVQAHVFGHQPAPRPAGPADPLPGFKRRRPTEHPPPRPARPSTPTHSRPPQVLEGRLLEEPPPRQALPHQRALRHRPTALQAHRGRRQLPVGRERAGDNYRLGGRGPATTTGGEGEGRRQLPVGRERAGDNYRWGGRGPATTTGGEGECRCLEGRCLEGRCLEGRARRRAGPEERAASPTCSATTPTPTPPPQQHV
jgi:hypothetical protein